MKNWIAIIMAFLILTSLVACGTSDEGIPNTAGSNQNSQKATGNTLNSENAPEKQASKEELLQAFKKAGYETIVDSEATLEDFDIFGIWSPADFCWFAFGRETNIEQYGECGYFRFDSEFDAYLAFGCALSVLNGDGHRFVETTKSNGCLATYTEGDADFGTIYRLVQVGNVIIFAMEDWDIDVENVTYNYEMNRVLESLGF